MPGQGRQTFGRRNRPIAAFRAHPIRSSGGLSEERRMKLISGIIYYGIDFVS